MSAKPFSGAFKAGTALSEAMSRASLLPQKRCFSVTPSRSAHALAFTPTSSPELDSILAEIRDHILLPSYLPEEQRRRLYQPKWENKLRGDPVTMELDGTQLKFTHRDLFALPNTRRILFRAVDRMQTRDDFENLPRLLEGLHNARRRLKSFDYTNMTRKAGNKGAIFTIIESARMVRKTGFRLDTSEKVSDVLYYVQRRAVDAGWEEQATRKALVWAELVVDLLEDRTYHGTARRRKSKKHQSSSAVLAEEEGQQAAQEDEAAAAQQKEGEEPAGFPLHRDPQILAARLHMAAAVAAKLEGGSDADGKVARYAREVVELWPAGRGLLSLHPEAAYRNAKAPVFYLRDPGKLVRVGSHIVHGLDLAAQVVAADNADLAAELRSRRDAVAGEVEAALPELAPESGSRLMYNKLFAPAAPAAEADAE